MADLTLKSTARPSKDGGLLKILLDRLGIGGAAKPAEGAKPKGNAPGGTAETRMGRSLRQACEELRAHGAKRVLVQGDAAFRAEAEAALGPLAAGWASTDFREVAAGALNAESCDYARFDAVLVGGADLPTRFRHAVRQMQAAAPGKPVIWVGEGFEFCRGVLPAPSDADEVEALLFNHFEQFFGLKDPLQYRIDLLHGAERRTLYRILKPNESLVIRLSDHWPERRQAVAVDVTVSHPFLTQGRHYRLRLCADVHWRGSFTTLHSSHEFGRDPAGEVEFRLAAARARGGEVVFTVPNYGSDLVEGLVEFGRPGARRSGTRLPDTLVEELRIPVEAAATQYDVAYRGYGGTFWFAQEPGLSERGPRGCISGNHHVSVQRENRLLPPADAAEMARWAELDRQGFMIDPLPVPIGEAGPLAFGFDCDAANPAARWFRVHFFDGAGRPIGESRFEKSEPGTVFGADLLAGFDHPDAAHARLAIVCPDWPRLGARRKGFKLLPDLVVEHRESGDRDVTEFQPAWRNLGVAIPDFPHWLTPALSVVGRTNVFGRVRIGRGYRTGLLVVNASGRKSYDVTASVQVTARNTAGAARHGSLSVPPFGWRLVWIDEIVPGLEHHLSPDGMGALLVQSGDADLCCQIVTVNAERAVSLQHLWGY